MSGSADLRLFLSQLPKAELHAHFEGTVEPATLIELAEKNSIRLDTPVELQNGVQILAPSNLSANTFQLSSFSDFIRLYVKISECIIHPEDILLIAQRYAKSAREQCIEQSEMYFSASTFSLLGRDLNALFDALCEAQSLSEKTFGTRLRWIFDIVRNGSKDGLEAIAFAEQAKQRGVSVVAIGIAGDESRASVTPFLNAFKKAEELGYAKLAHAGETAGASSIRETIEGIQPIRIGHGVRALEDPELVSLLAESATPIEVCPWSNIKLGIFSAAEHPLAQMLDQGLNVVIASDDPGIFAKSLTDNYLFAAEQGVDRETLKSIAQKSIELCLR